MSQAQKNQEQSARVHTVPRHSHIAAVTKKPRSLPPPPPLAAYARLPRPQLSLAPRLSVPAPAHLAIVPLWDDANLPLRPAAKPENPVIHWIGSTTVSLAVGALVAASLMTIRFGDYSQILPHGQLQPSAPAQPAELQLAAAEPVPVQVFEADEPLSIDISEVEEVTPGPQPILIPELTVTSRKHVSKPTKLTKQVKVAAPKKAPKQRGKRGRTMPAAISESVIEAQPTAEAQPEPASTTPVAQTIEAAAVSEAQAPIAAAPEAPAAEAAALPAAPEVVEPAAPALPGMLTRDQVRSGLDSVRAKVLACTNGTYGKIHADVTISAPGKVSSAVIDGTFAGTKAADCMVQKINSAKFAAFSGADISVRYPYSF
jgi:hypothetical protein